MENISYIYIYQFNNQHPEWDTIQTQSVMSNQNKNYLNQYLVNQLTEVKMEIYKLESEQNKYGLEQPQWQINGLYDGLLFRRDWLGIQIDELNK